MQAWLDSGIMQAGPPQSVDMQQATQIEAAKGLFRKSLDWVVDAVIHRASPYGGYDYGIYDGPAYAEAANPPEINSSRDIYRENIGHAAMQQILMSGFLMSVGTLRKHATNLLPKAGTVLKTLSASPASRRLLKKSAIATGGLAGLAAVAAITAYVLNRKAGPRLRVFCREAHYRLCWPTSIYIRSM